MNNELKEQIFDLMLKQALEEYLDTEFQAIDEMVANSPPHEFSPEFERKMKKLINSVGRRDRIRKCKRICLKAIKVFVIVAAIMGVVFCVLLTQPAVIRLCKTLYGISLIGN